MTTPASPTATDSPDDAILWHRSLIFAALAFLITMIGTTLPTPLYPLYQEAFGLSQLMITVIFAVYSAGTIGALLLCGRWSDQIGRRKMVYGALGFSAASALCFLWGDSVTLLLIGRILSGISAGLITGAGTVYVIELAPVVRQNTAALLATAVNMTGLGLGPLLGGLFAQYGPWPTHLIFGVNLAMILLAAILIASVPETVKVSRSPSLRPQTLVLPAAVRPVFIPAAIAGIAGFAVLGFFTALAPAFMRVILHVDNLVLVGLLVFTVFTSSTVGQMMLGRVPQRFALPIGCVVLAIGALSIAAGIQTSSLLWVIIGALLVGSGQGLGFRAGLTAVAQASPSTKRGEVLSTFFVVLYTALSLPVIGLGLWSDTWGLRSAGTGFAVIVAALALLAWWLLIVLRRRAGAAGIT